MVVVGRLGLFAFLRGASCGAGRLDHVDVAGASDDLLPWDPVRLLSVLVYLVLFSRFLQFEERDADDTTGSVLFRAWLHVDTVPALQVFKTDHYGLGSHQVVCRRAHFQY